ncbi:MAG: beta galactosidase jelly roll domain-containing protein [Actinomycetota bacterium]|nr:beta galactosidase jelly roll domain-containing protein [Actinomycetota bacterium]
MRSVLFRGVLLAALTLVAATGASVASAASLAGAPTAKTVTRDGHGGRLLLDGWWGLRHDRGDRGLAAQWENQKSTAGFERVRLPNAYNAGDKSHDSLIGWPAWYRTDFRLPRGTKATTWRLRFEAVNHRATVWLNGRLLGQHAGAFEPFELALDGANPRGMNRLVVRVDNRRLPTDFPPARYTETDQPRGGWWNYGGIVREVYLRPVNQIDFDSVQVRPEIDCLTCSAKVNFRVAVRNDSAKARRVSVAGTFGKLPVRFAAKKIKPRQTKTLITQLQVPDPHLWSPRDPFLYPVELTARAGARKDLPAAAASYELKTGLRSVEVSSEGRLLLNGAAVNLRGVAVHEDLPGKGAALTPADHEQTVAQTKDVGATLVRSHYPLHPYFQELADRNGLLVWSEVPVYQMRSDDLAPASVRREAVKRVATNIDTNQNHPSVIVWSIGNELDEKVPRPVRQYINAATRTVRRLDPSRPVAMALAGHPRVACVRGYEPLDLIGINEYFGWYSNDIANREDLSGYLDRMRTCYPTKALMVSEFGAEANRHGPVEEKGTHEFQQDWMRYHLDVFATKPWLSGASYWTLREFLIYPEWAGGNPKPTPPFHQKGVVAYEGSLKPGYSVLRDSYRATQQIP